MDENGVSKEVVGAAIEVHRHLGPGLLESAYKLCLSHELVLRNVGVERQSPIPIHYKGSCLDCGFRLDLLVDRKVIVELKAVDSLSPVHQAQVLTYLKLTGHRLGLLLNFNVERMRDGIKRIVLNL